MKRIKHAQFLRSIETDKMTTAEVEFAWEGDFGADVQDERYIAVLKKENEGEFGVERIVKKNAEFDLDWYDNPMHEAFEDVTERVFSKSGDDMSSDMPDREGFVREVMGFEGVCEDMDCRQGIIRK